MIVQRSLAVVTALALGSLSACASTTQQVQANGEPLSAQIKEHHYEGYWLSDEWHPPTTEINFDSVSQGSEAIDELDFYAIAGDEAAVARIVEARDAENFGYRVLYGGASVGGGLVVAGFIIGGEKYAEGDEDFAASDQGQLAGGLIVGGIFTILGSYILPTMLLLKNETVDDGHYLPRDRAVESAAAYNERIGQSQVSAAP